MELLNEFLPGWQSYLVIVLASALTAWIVTMAVKRLGHDYFDQVKNGQRPWWWRSGLRVCAALVGLGVALGFELTFVSAIVGLISGAMSSLIVLLLKRRLSKVAPEVQDFSGTFSMTVPVDFDKDKLAEDLAKSKAKAKEAKEAAAKAKEAEAKDEDEP